MQHVFTCRIGHECATRDDLTKGEVLATARNVLDFDGCTTWEANGYWKGGYEQTTVIEIAGLEEAEAKALMNRLPRLADALGQTSVYGTIAGAECAERFASEHTEQIRTA